MLIVRFRQSPGGGSLAAERKRAYRKYVDRKVAKGLLPKGKLAFRKLAGRKIASIGVEKRVGQTKSF